MGVMPFEYISYVPMLIYLEPALENVRKVRSCAKLPKLTRRIHRGRFPIEVSITGNLGLNSALKKSNSDERGLSQLPHGDSDHDCGIHDGVERIEGGGEAPPSWHLTRPYIDVNRWTQ